MAEFEPLHDPETGTHIGWMVEAEDGALVGLDLEGSITGALDPSTGELIDHSPYELADDGAAEGYEYDAEAELQQRLAELEERAEQPTYLPVPIPVEPDREQQTADLIQQAQHWERVHDRPMTLAEKRRLGETLTEAQIAGEERPDVQSAADRLAAEGRGLPDIDSGTPAQQRSARQALAAELYADQERSAAAERGEDDLTQDQPPARAEGYDVDTHEGRVQYKLDAMRGAATPDMTYSGGDTTAESWEADE